MFFVNNFSARISPIFDGAQWQRRQQTIFKKKKKMKRKINKKFIARLFLERSQSNLLSNGKKKIQNTHETTFFPAHFAASLTQYQSVDNIKTWCWCIMCICITNWQLKAHILLNPWKFFASNCYIYWFK